MMGEIWGVNTVGWAVLTKCRGQGRATRRSLSLVRDGWKVSEESGKGKSKVHSRQRKLHLQRYGGENLRNSKFYRARVYVHGAGQASKANSGGSHRTLSGLRRMQPRDNGGHLRVFKARTGVIWNTGSSLLAEEETDWRPRLTGPGREATMGLRQRTVA